MPASLFPRRDFLRAAAAIGCASRLPAASYARAAGANGRLRVASVGTGGRGWLDLTGLTAGPHEKHVEVAALCDIDESEPHLGRAATKFPAAARFTDWRKLLDAPAGYDAVVVSTPDHMHAAVALPAMALGKHVYCQKPLTHTVFEARQMRAAADKAGVVTQMGNQIQSHEVYRTAVKAVRDGVIGKVKEVHSWQAGAMKWLPTSGGRPVGTDPVPAAVGNRWTDWLGVAPERPYVAKVYHPFNWRGWQDFSTGQIGDFGCHILDPVFTALGLTAPTTVRAEASPMDREIWYNWSVVGYEFPGTKFTAGPTLKVTWYDGDKKFPPRDRLGVADGVTLPGSGSILIGEKASLLVPHVAPPQALVEGKPAGVRLELVPAVDHYGTWVDACLGTGKPGSHFGYSGPLTETVLLGSVAIRTPGETLTWDAAGLAIPNNKAANALLRKPYRKGWEPTWVG